MRFDEKTLERIIEQITHQVLVMVEEGTAQTSGPPASGAPLSAANYVDRVQPVVSAGADRVASTLGVAPANGEMFSLNSLGTPLELG